jgi:hypothetical protein
MTEGAANSDASSAMQASVASDAQVPAWWDEHPLRLAVLAVVLVAIAASFTGLWNGFAYDDVLLIKENPAVRFLRGPLAFFQESYWGPVANSPSLYRPVIVLGWAWQWALGGGAAWIFHAVNIVLYACTSAALLVFLRQMVPHGGALLGALLFAAHPVHVEAVANVVGQSELLVATLMLSGLALYASDRHRGRVRARTVGLMVAGFVFGLFTKEHAIVLPALLIGVEYSGARLRFASHPLAWQDARRIALALGLIAAMYLTWRAQILGAVTGDLPHWAMHNRTMLERVAIMTALVPEFVRLLLFPASLYSDYAPGLIPVLPEFGLRHIPGLLILAGVVTGIAVALRRGVGLPVLAALWFAVTFAPTSNVLFPIGVIMAERTLFMPSVAVVILFTWVTIEAAQWTPARRGVMSAFVIAAVVFGTIHSAIRTRVWTDNPTLFSTLAVEAPTNFRGLMAVGELMSFGGRWPEADSMYALAMEHYPEHVPARLAYVRELQVHNEYGRALEQVRIARRMDPTSSQGMASEVLCLLHFQRFTEARAELLDASAAGWGSPLVTRLRVVVDSMLAVTDSADTRNRFVREGRAYSRYTEPLVVRVDPDFRRRLIPPGGAQPAPRSAMTPASGALGVTP